MKLKWLKKMTVKELIEKLQEFDGELPVWIEHDESIVQAFGAYEGKVWQDKDAALISIYTNF